jgi:hypothetical protein
MKIFSSLAAVMALWLAVSFLLWLAYRVFRRRDSSKQERVLSEALALLDEAGPVFAAIRTRVSGTAGREGNYRAGGGARPGETLREDVRALLNAIEVQSSYFERVNAARKQLQRTFGVEDVQALSEILQIRRDFWAASEVFLMEGIEELGPEFADVKAFEAFQAEARALLFLEGHVSAGDPVGMRLAIAGEEALAFKAEAERAIAAELEKSRFPTAREFAEIPWGLIKGTAQGLREVQSLLGDAAATARTLARAVTTKGVNAAAEELRRVRATMPGKFATTFERAGGLARNGGQTLKRHYEFVLEAQELRARYAEFLARAPELTDKGKQFLARLELERRAEQFRGTSSKALYWARRALVVAIAYLIAGLQFVQAKITPPQGKQLAPLNRASPRSAEEVEAGAGTGPEPEAEAPTAEDPLRVLLLPASSYSGGNFGRAGSRQRRRGGAEPEEPEEDPETVLRDFMDGGTRPQKPAAKGSARKTSKQRARKGPEEAADHASLLDRLATVAAHGQAEDDKAPASEKPKAKGSWFSLRAGRK